MNDISEIMKKFETTLQVFCKPVLDKFEKGLDGDYIEKILTEASISNDNVKNLYHWRNGIKFDTAKYIGEFDFCSQGKMLPLEEAVIHYRTYLKDSLWRKNYFPLFTTNAGDYLLYDVDKNSKTSGMLLFYSPSLLITEPETAYDNLESFIKTIISCYEQGIYKFNKANNTLDVDEDSEFEISTKMNPRAEYWNR